MRCEDALVQMLDAEPEDLVPGAGDLGAHISSCQRCAAVAHTLSDETARLARAFSETRRAVPIQNRIGRWVRPEVVTPLARLAAAVLIAVLVRSLSGSVHVRPAMPVVHVVASAPTANAPVVEPVSTTKRIAPALVKLPSSPPTLPVAYQPVAVVAAPPPVEAVAPDIQVDPEPGTLATVWRVRNPNVTVVWLTK